MTDPRIKVSKVSKWVINLSTYNITEDERELLDNGMTYSITPATLPTIDLVAKIETTLTRMSTEEADTIGADLSSIIRKANLKPPKRNITRKQSTSLTLSPGGGGRISSPLMFFFHHPETAQAMKLKLSDFKDTCLRHILQFITGRYISRCYHGNKITKGTLQNLTQ